MRRGFECQIPDFRYRIPDPPARSKPRPSGIWHLASGVPSVIAILAITLMASSAVLALEVPYLAGRVNDQANLLEDGFEGQLEERLRVLEEETGAQVAVLTIPSLEGDPLEDFSIRVVETWKLGRAGADDGVLILIARDERRMRIEVGYGLEPVLTDAEAGRIVSRMMAPKLGGFDPGALVFLLLFGLPFINAALVARGASGWILGFFLAPFFFIFPAVIFGVWVGVVAAALWLAIFPALRLVLPKASARGGSRSGGGTFWGPFIGGGGGGGFSGGGFGGFSGGGGSFGGGGASGGW
jgi:uncharacterized protein